MVSYRIVATAGLVASVYALPLNINLGAYSPALVVGDGEISFGGGQDVSQLFNTLEGAAVNAATGKSNTGAAQAAAPAVAAPATAVPAAAPVAAASITTAPAAAVVAEESTKDATAVAANPASDSTLSEQAASISTLQGMGKEIAPREGESPVAKRDLQGFDRALQYAENALTKGPVIQLGTGEGGAGVGIIVDNRPTTAAAAGTAGAARPAAAGKRDETSASQPRRRTKITTMYVRRGVPTAMQSSDLETRDIKSFVVPAAESLNTEKREVTAEEKRESTSALDAINLNVDDPQGITMTFVETSDDDDEE
ncbi:hypothetical protein BKA67DRAFT_661895 [Truncatella angustata]|uniref:Uncharacterized protein n=1 Tax=Truncatella angustata TaxID=152316 RepID=A0A9P8UFH3_9PEZI|nr:uncharacterized protein BKA67DRAFT_661895 [Truncatella angustata]KAH6648959.1 hypothetical protein BKA67DRAFT_661895 [Truncatella angustata]KAH8195588.1 hypothetical protein TruAng_010244 [Truncatella angustata]